jgi:hypothetical protein
MFGVDPVALDDCPVSSQWEIRVNGLFRLFVKGAVYLILRFDDEFAPCSSVSFDVVAVDLSTSLVESLELLVSG